MAHFAEIDNNNVVVRVIVVNNNELLDENGVEQEHLGAAFCNSLFGGTWVQTSYNGNIRKNFAGVGFVYHPDLDAFIEPQPYPSWTLNTETYSWDAPVERPTDGAGYCWLEEDQTWSTDC